MSHDPESRATPVYNDIDTWPDEFTDDEISALVSPHVRVGAKAHWPTLGFNFRNDRANDLRYASQMLKDLIYPGVECSLADFMKSRPKFHLRGLEKNKACDMSGFANFIYSTVLALQGHKVVEIQNCLSVVLRNASGVGKTFATYALTRALLSCGSNISPSLCI